MANQFLNLPVPASTGAGAAVDTSKMGATKTVVVGGSIKGSVVIEYANDAAGAGPWAELPNGAFSNPGRVTIDVAARWMRARTDGAASANADVGGSTGETPAASFVEVTAAPVDISALPAFKTVVSAGAVNVEISEDGTSWSQAFSFQGPGGQSQVVIGQFARVTGGGSVWMGGAADGLDDGWPAPVDSTTYIYARPGGSDTAGNGTLANPYATFSRAMLDVPKVIPPMQHYVVDITGVQELLPPDYAVPPIKSWGYYTVFVNDLDQRIYSTALTIRAQYTPFTGVPAPDRTISALEVTGVVRNAVTGLIEITTTKNYALNALAGAIIQTQTSPKRAAMVYGNTAGPNSVITLANSSSNAAWNAGPFDLFEQSATLTAQNTNEAYTGVSFRHIDSFFCDGVKFRNADPSPGAYSVNCIQSSTPIFGACDIEGIYVGPGTQYFYINSCMLQNKTVESEGQTELNFSGCVLQNMPTLYTYDVESLALFGCGVRNCAALGPRPVVLFTPAFSTVGAGSATKMTVVNTIIEGSVDDSDFGTPGYGILNNAPSASIANCAISDCANDAIHCTGNGSAIVQVVGGAGNGGVGIFADMGSQVSVDATTSVTGTGGDVKAGSLAAATYATLRTPTVQYDLPPNAADLNVATGARIFNAA